MTKLPVFLLIVLLTATSLSPAWASSDNTDKQQLHREAYAHTDNISFGIQAAIQELSAGKPLNIDGEYLFAARVLPEFYSNREFRPVWHDYNTLVATLQLLKNAWIDGLSPEDYHAEGIQRILDSILDRMERDRSTSQWVAEFDILVTDAVMLYAYHLVAGKVDHETRSPKWNYSFREITEDMILNLERAIENGTIVQALHDLRPGFPLYKLYMENMVIYQKLAQQHSWKTIPEGAVIHPGDNDTRIPLIRQRLHHLNEMLGDTNLHSAVYDTTLVRAVKAFQNRNALNPDGIIGQSTLSVMNETVEQRINKLRVNMERMRWVVSNLSESFIVVNIAAFKAYYMVNYKPVFTTRVQVGRTYTQTPVFKSRLSYIEFNPTWTVPRSIIRSSIIGHMKSDPNYLASHNFELLTMSGELVDPATVNTAKISANNFPYMVRQKPGINNSLGRVKFIFPNNYSIYLHDTPSKSLFNREDRALSHGCIRTENPLDLAELLLDSPKWSKAKIDEVLKSQKTTRVYPEKDIDILLLYWTAGYYDGKEIGFFKDVYNRDQPILNALNQKQEFQAPQPETSNQSVE